MRIDLAHCKVGKVTVGIHFMSVRKTLGLYESLSCRYPVLAGGVMAM